MTEIYLERSEILAILNDLQTIRDQHGLTPMLLKLHSRLAHTLENSEGDKVRFILFPLQAL